MKKYEMAIQKANEDVLRGTLYAPDQLKHEFPCVIISHGFLANAKEQADIAEKLAQNNIVAFTFDFSGGSLDSESDGDIKNMSVLTEVDDLKDVIKFIRQFKELKEIFLLGISQGGFVSAITATQEESIKGLILVYPALVIPDDARKLYETIDKIPEEPKALDVEVGKKYFEDVIEMDSIEEIKNYSGPVLLIHGTADELVPIDYSRRADQAYSNSHLIEYEDQGHGFDETFRSKMIDEAIRFVDENSSL